MRPISLIVVHCTASPNGRWTTTADIDAWHKVRGFRREPPARLQHNPELFSIGYHHVIYTNGTIATGRSHAEVGAHAAGHNANSLGIALVGTDRFSVAQWQSLRELINALTQQQGLTPPRYPNARIVGHRDLPNVHKACPGFDVAAWRRGGMDPLTNQLYPEEVSP